MICEECNEESIKNGVCSNCGLVYEDHPIDFHPIKSLNKNLKEKRYRNDFVHHLAPDIQYTHKYPKRSKNLELRRVFKQQYKDGNKIVKTMKSFIDIGKYCSLLHLPKNIKNEALNIYRCVIKKDKNFFGRNHRNVAYIAFIKIAANIHQFPIKNSEYMELIDDYKKKGNKTKKFNRAYVDTKRLLNIRFERPEIPKYIDYVCSILNLPYTCAYTIHKMYSSLRRCFTNGFKIEGYILALYYIRFRHEYNITFDLLENLFGVSRITISSRRNEINKITR